MINRISLDKVSVGLKPNQDHLQEKHNSKALNQSLPNTTVCQKNVYKTYEQPMMNSQNGNGVTVAPVS
jgi:hypothetical protein